MTSYNGLLQVAFTLDLRSRRSSVDCGARVETDDVDCEAPDVAEVPDVDSEALFEVPDVAEAPAMGSFASPDT